MNRSGRRMWLSSTGGRLRTPSPRFQCGTRAAPPGVSTRVGVRPGAEGFGGAAVASRVVRRKSANREERTGADAGQRERFAQVRRRIAMRGGEQDRVPESWIEATTAAAMPASQGPLRASREGQSFAAFERLTTTSTWSIHSMLTIKPSRRCGRALPSISAASRAASTFTRQSAFRSKLQLKLSCDWL